MSSSLSSLFIIFLLFSLVSVSENSDGAGVGVIDVSPTFSYLHFSSVGRVHWIEVNVSDYNSWKDIYKITLTFIGDGEPITVISYTQYSDRNDTSNRVDWFNETYGNYMIKDMTGITYRVFNGSTVDERCNMNIRFTFRPISALKVVVVAEDLSGAMAVSIVDYPPLFSGGSMEPGPISMDFIALILAAVGTAGATKAKYGPFRGALKNRSKGIEGVKKDERKG